MDMSAFDALPAPKDPPNRGKSTAERWRHVVALAVLQELWADKTKAVSIESLKVTCAQRGLSSNKNYLGTVMGAGQETDGKSQGLKLWCSDGDPLPLADNALKCARGVDPTEFIAWLESIEQTPESFAAWIKSLPSAS